MAGAPPARSLDHMTAAAIETHDLHMHYGQGRTEVRALDGVDLTIEEGEMVAIMGPSGSGKSTLLHVVGALESPTSGTVAVAGQRFDGLDDKGLTRLRRDHTASGDLRRREDRSEVRPRGCRSCERRPAGGAADLERLAPALI